MAAIKILKPSGAFIAEHKIIKLAMATILAVIFSQGPIILYILYSLLLIVLAILCRLFIIVLAILSSLLLIVLAILSRLLPIILAILHSLLPCFLAFQLDGSWASWQLMNCGESVATCWKTAC
jgi:hypothetical protein